jgi:hypothetical protein
MYLFAGLSKRAAGATVRMLAAVRASATLDSVARNLWHRRATRSPRGRAARPRLSGSLKLWEGRPHGRVRFRRRALPARRRHWMVQSRSQVLLQQGALGWCEHPGSFEVASFRPGKLGESEPESLPPPVFEFLSMLVSQCLNFARLNNQRHSGVAPCGMGSAG